MLSPRKEAILKSIVGQYISKATPVPSQSIIRDGGLGISAATIRNEMAQLEQEGYISRAHPSAGSVPSDKGYRSYVESIGDVKLPVVEQRLVSHLFHQVERELDEWLHLAATVMARMVQNAVVVTMPKSEACRLKHLELVSLHDSMVLVVLVLIGANVRQQLINLEQNTSQLELTVVTNKLNAAFSGLNGNQISANGIELSAAEQEITDCLVKIMATEDTREHKEQYLDGLHLMFNQPEFAHGQRMLNLMELVEQRSLMRSILPPQLTSFRVQVIIGQENKEEAIRDYSVVISHYGLPNEAVGTIGVIGPTRMPYARSIAAVGYLSSVLGVLMSSLYGRKTTAGPDLNASN